MSRTKKLENLTKACLPPAGARLAKQMSVGVRYRSQLGACKDGGAPLGNQFPQTTLPVAILPQCGTIWVEKMIGSYQGFHERMIPQVARYESRAGGSHDYELPDDMFTRFDNALVLTKIHIHGSMHKGDWTNHFDDELRTLYKEIIGQFLIDFGYEESLDW